MPTRRAEATWKGDLKSGHGWVRSETGTVEGTFSAASRFEDGRGTNPEELMGAAHAGCFSMAFSLMLSEAGYTAEAIDTSADVRIEQSGGGYAITQISLSTKADVPGIGDDEFHAIAEKAKEGCPVSQALKAVPITLTAELVSS